MPEERAARRATRRDLIHMPPAINVDQGRSRNYASIANDLYHMSVKVEDRLDQEAAVDAMRAGMSGDINDGLMFHPSVRGRAYTQQAIKSYWQNLEATSRVRIEELAAANRNDPTGMQQAIDAYIETTTATLPSEFKERARAYLTATSRSYIAGARADLVKLRQGQAKASALLAERTATLEIDRLSERLFSPNPEVAGAAADGLDAVQARLAALYSSTVTDDLGNKVPVFDSEQRARAAVMIEERIAKGAIKGWYDAQDDKVGALMVIADGALGAPIMENGKQVGVWNPLMSLDAETTEELITKLRSAFSAELGIRSSLAAAQDRERKRREDALLVQLYQDYGEHGGSDLIEQAREMLDTVEDPGVARQLQQMIAGGSITGQLSDSTSYNLALIDALQGRFDLQGEQYGTLPLKARVELYKVNQQAQTKAEADRTMDDGDFRDARDLIFTQYGYADYETAIALAAQGVKVPQLNSALEKVAALMQAKFYAEQAGEPFDSRRWYMEHVGEAAAERVKAITDARAAVTAARAALNAVDRQLMGKSLQEKRDSPEYQAAIQAWREATATLNALTSSAR